MYTIKYWRDIAGWYGDMRLSLYQPYGWLGFYVFGMVPHQARDNEMTPI